MKLTWFKKTGIIYFPNSVIGWVISIACMVYTVYTFISIDGLSHSVSDTLINFVFRLLIIFAVYTLIGYLTSSDTKE